MPPRDMRVVLYYFIGLGCIIYGIIGLITGKTRSHWWTGLRLVSKDEGPREYWLYIGLLFGIGLFAVISLTIGLLFFS